MLWYQLWLFLSNRHYLSSQALNLKLSLKKRLQVVRVTPVSIANAVGSYTLAVMQLENGGLNAKYYDNQWLLDEPVIERGPLLSFISADDLKVELEA